MTLAVLIGIIVIGFLLVMLELFVISGTIIPGIIGAVMLISGIIFSYTRFDMTTGHTTLISTIAFSTIVMYFAFRAKTWQQVALHTQISSKANPEQMSFHVGDKGIALSRLAPTGKIMLNGQITEATTFNTFIDANSQVEVTQVLPDKIYVKPI